MVTLIDFIYILIASGAYSLYLITVKRMPSPMRLIGLFWIYTLTYLGHVALYLYRTLAEAKNPYAVEILIREFTFYNAPLYLVLGICFTWSVVIFNNLLKQYDITLVVPFAHISILLTQLGYLLLGDPSNPIEFLGVTIITLGALLTGVKSLGHPIQALKSIPKPLFRGVLTYSILQTIVAIITFFITQDTRANEFIINQLKYFFPFTQHLSLFKTHLGAYFFIVTMFLFYLTHHRQTPQKIVNTLKSYWPVIFVACGLYALTNYADNLAYLLIPDQTVLAGLSKINTPLLLLFGHMLLHEKITPPRIVGSLIVLLGGIVIAFS